MGRNVTQLIKTRAHGVCVLTARVLSGGSHSCCCRRCGGPHGHTPATVVARVPIGAVAVLYTLWRALLVYTRLKDTGYKDRI